jgi:dUTP pyrophosphatase
MLKILQRSGLALKSGIIPLGGVIDSGYRNEIGVILVNISDDDFEIRQGDRIAQAALIPIERFAWKEFDALEDSDRGKSGLGASGIK